MRKGRSWGSKEPDRASRTSCNPSTSAKRYKGTLCVIVGRNHLVRKELFSFKLDFIQSLIEPDREWTVGSPDFQEWQVLDLGIQLGTEADLLGTV